MRRDLRSWRKLESEGYDVVRSIQIGAIQAIVAGRHLSRWKPARAAAPAFCDIAAVLIVGEESIQAARILSRWSRPEDAGANAAASIRRRRQLGRAMLRELLVKVARFAPLHCRFAVEPEGRPFVRNAN